MRRFGIVVAFALLFAPLGSMAPPAKLTYTSIGQEGMPDPFRPGRTLLSVGGGQADQGLISFNGSSSGADGGFNLDYYAGDGTTVIELARVQTVYPDICDEVIPSLGVGWFDAGRFAFGAHLSSQPGPCTGIHIRNADGTFQRLIDLTTTVPGHSGQTFIGFGRVALSGDYLAFEGYGPGTVDEGLFLLDLRTADSITRVLDKFQTMPNCNGRVFGEPTSGLAVGSGGVAFIAFDIENGETCGGVFFWNGSHISVIADTSTLIPTSLSPFTVSGFDNVSYDGTRVAFAGAHGVYHATPGVSGLGIIANTSTLIPGTSTNFVDFTNVTIDGAKAAFEGMRPNPSGSPLSGVYVWDQQAITPVAQPGQRLGGQTIVQAFATENALDGNTVGFLATYPSTPSNVVYKAVLPGGTDVGAAAFQTSGRVSLRRCEAPCTKDLTIKVKNYGSIASQVAIWVGSSDPGGALPEAACGSAATPTLSPLLAPGQTYQMTCTVEYGPPGTYNLFLFTAPTPGGLGADGNPANNNRTASVQVVI